MPITEKSQNVLYTKKCFGCHLISMFVSIIYFRLNCCEYVSLLVFYNTAQGVMSLLSLAHIMMTLNPSMNNICVYSTLVLISMRIFHSEQILRVFNMWIAFRLKSFRGEILVNRFHVFSHRTNQISLKLEYALSSIIKIEAAFDAW